MIVKVTFQGQVNNWVILFGDSYKPWKTQFNEYVQRNRKQIADIVKVETSKSKRVAWGGLKWCSEQNFQGELNREGCRSTDADNPKPRYYVNMVFNFSQKAYDHCVERLIKSKGWCND